MDKNQSGLRLTSHTSNGKTFHPKDGVITYPLRTTAPKNLNYEELVDNLEILLSGYNFKIINTDCESEGELQIVHLEIDLLGNERSFLDLMNVSNLFVSSELFSEPTIDAYNPQ